MERKEQSLDEFMSQRDEVRKLKELAEDIRETRKKNKEKADLTSEMPASKALIESLIIGDGKFPLEVKWMPGDLAYVTMPFLNRKATILVLEQDSVNSYEEALRIASSIHDHAAYLTEAACKKCNGLMKTKSFEFGFVQNCECHEHGGIVYPKAAK